jgi:hypothetical protein
MYVCCVLDGNIHIFTTTQRDGHYQKSTIYNQHLWDALHQTSDYVYNVGNQKVELPEPLRRTNEEYVHCTEIKVCVPEENFLICNLYARPQNLRKATISFVMSISPLRIT